MGNACGLSLYSNKVKGLLCLLFGTQTSGVVSFSTQVKVRGSKSKFLNVYLKIIQGLMEPLLRSPGSQSCNWAFSHSTEINADKKG